METKKKKAVKPTKSGTKKPVKSVDDYKSIHGRDTSYGNQTWTKFKG